MTNCFPSLLLLLTGSNTDSLRCLSQVSLWKNVQSDPCVFFLFTFSAAVQGTFSSQITLILVHVVHYLPSVWQLNLTLAGKTQLSDCGCCQVKRLSSGSGAVTVIYYVLGAVLLVVGSAVAHSHTSFSYMFLTKSTKAKDFKTPCYRISFYSRAFFFWWVLQDL